jgi:hypothetical protein
MTTGSAGPTGLPSALSRRTSVTFALSPFDRRLLPPLPVPAALETGRPVVWPRTFGRSASPTPPALSSESRGQSGRFCPLDSQPKERSGHPSTRPRFMAARTLGTEADAFRSACRAALGRAVIDTPPEPSR